MQKKKSFEPTINDKESLSREHRAIYGQLELTVVFTNHDHVQLRLAALPFDQFSFNWSQNPFFQWLLALTHFGAWFALTYLEAYQLTSLAFSFSIKLDSNEAINSKMDLLETKREIK
jgi:hypothetical protein